MSPIRLFMISVDMLNVIMVNVVAPTNQMISVAYTKIQQEVNKSLKI
jgi:hypothetical protein